MVPHHLRNLICPWQTKREILAQARTAEKILRSLQGQERAQFLQLDYPDRWAQSAEKPPSARVGAFDTYVPR